MSSISVLNKANVTQSLWPMSSVSAQATSLTVQESALQNISLPSPSSTVSLNQIAGAYGAQTYSMAASNLVWESPVGDEISPMMAHNFSGSANVFAGLGSALLKRFKADSSDFSQSVLKPATAATSAEKTANTYTALQSQLHQFADNQVSLQIQTQSGIHAELSLDSQANGLAVQVKSSGNLSDSERNALASLADAFQIAIDGLQTQPPQLQLSGLTQLDTTVLSSVDLHIQIQLNPQSMQTLDFHADSKQRNVNLSGPAGSIQVGVDMSNTAILGNQQQQSTALKRCLQQIDQASSRGKGDLALTQMFKDAFSQMNSNYNTSPATNLTTLPVSLTTQDHALLTGLADFNASVTQTTTTPNPLRSSEVDSFSYQTSQSTSIKGDGPWNRSFSQTQQSRLKASFHLPLTAGTSLRLSNDPASQNYTYHQISDTAGSTVAVAYNKGALVQASLSKTASQTERITRYEMGKLVDDSSNTANASLTHDFLPMLNALAQSSKEKTAADAFMLQQVLSQIHQVAGLQDSVSHLNAEKTSLSHS